MLPKKSDIKEKHSIIYEELSRLFRTVDLDKSVAQYIRDQIITRFDNDWRYISESKQNKIIEGKYFSSKYLILQVILLDDFL